MDHQISSPLVALVGVLIGASVSTAGGRAFPLIDDLYSWDDKNAAAVVVVERDSILYSKQFGFVDRDAGVRVTEDTVFPASGALPPLLALTVLALHERGRLDAHAPLSEVLPSLVLPEGISAAEITVENLLTHDHPIGDGVAAVRMQTCDFTSELLLDLVRHHGVGARPHWRPRSVSTILTTLAMEKATGMPWPEVLAKETFVPLGMTSTTCFPGDVPAARLPRLYYDGPEGTESVDPAGLGPCPSPMSTFYTTARDLGRWLTANLSEGMIDGESAIPAEAVRAAHELYVPLPADRPSSAALGTYLGHGLGWDVYLYEGEVLLMTHIYELTVSLMPSRGVGIGTLSAQRQLGNLVNDPTRFLHLYATGYVYDTILERPGAREEHVESLAQLRAMMRQLEHLMASDRNLDAEAGAVRDAPEPIPLEHVAGVYENSHLGTMTCEIVGGDLVVAIGALRGTAESPTHSPKTFRSAAIGSLEFERADGKPAESLRWGGQVFRRADL